LILEITLKVPRGLVSLKSFVIGVRNIENPFVYFTYLAVVIDRYNKLYRTAEAHGGSKFKRRLLLLQIESFDETNETLMISNALLDIWETT
jgi:hypothetical protein